MHGKRGEKKKGGLLLRRGEAREKKKGRMFGAEKRKGGDRRRDEEMAKVGEKGKLSITFLLPRKEGKKGKDTKHHFSTKGKRKGLEEA